jgi:hypothetical protein
MSGHRITYQPRPDATLASELSALTAAYKLVLDCHAKKKGTRPGAPDDAKESKHDRTAREQYTR